MARHVVAAVTDIPPGKRLAVEIAGREVVIFNLSGEFFGLLSRCPHQGGDLSLGRTTGLVEAGAPGSYRYTRQGEILRCPWHGWEFDIRTGQSVCEPWSIRASGYAVAVASGTEIMEGPYTAETVTVTVERDYIFIDA